MCRTMTTGPSLAHPSVGDRQCETPVELSPFQGQDPAAVSTIGARPNGPLNAALVALLAFSTSLVAGRSAPSGQLPDEAASALSTLRIGSPNAAASSTAAAPSFSGNEESAVTAHVDDRKVPLFFEPNQGQIADPVRFIARGLGYSLYVTDDELVAIVPQRSADPGASSSARRTDGQAIRVAEARMSRRGEAPAQPNAVLRTGFVGARSNLALEGQESQLGISNYFLGQDPAAWRTNVPHYGRLRYRDLYAGIDLVLHEERSGNRGTGRLEYDFEVRPGADPAAIRLSLRGAKEVRIDADGNLRQVLADGSQVIQRVPQVYQVIDGHRYQVDARYAMLETEAPSLRASARMAGVGGYEAIPALVGFQVASYRPEHPLIIDPAIEYWSVLGGNGHDSGKSIAVDEAGNTYVTGSTSSTDFPTPDGLETNGCGKTDAFVSKFDVKGTLLYATYLGGADHERGLGIAVDHNGNSYVTGETASANWPLVNAVDSTFVGYDEAFVVKLNAAGSALIYSSFLGGSNSDWGSAIAVDREGNAFVTGFTGSSDFPLSNPIYLYSLYTGNAFVVKLDESGDNLLFSTHLSVYEGTVGQAIAADDAGNAYVAGNADLAYGDGFLVKLDTSTPALLYSRLLGGGGPDWVCGLALDGDGDAYVAGITGSTDFPAFHEAAPSPDEFQSAVYIVKLDPTGDHYLYSTLLGENHVGIHEQCLAVDGAGNAYFTGFSDGQNPSVTSGRPRGTSDSPYFVAKIDATGRSLVYLLHLDGFDTNVTGIAADRAGNAYVTGDTWNGLRGYDAYVARISERQTVRVAVRGAGSIQSTDGRILCPETCRAAYSSGDQVSFVATPVAGHIFNGWNPTPCAPRFTVPAQNLTCVATFSRYVAAADAIGLYSPGDRTFYLRNSATLGVADITFGIATEDVPFIPLAGDWDGDGTVTAGLYNPATGVFQLRNNNTNGPPDLAFRFGPRYAGWLPIAGDWDGNGITTVGLFNPISSTFYLRNSNSAGAHDLAFRFGPRDAGWVPVAGDWNGDGVMTIALYNPAAGTFFLRNSNDAGVADLRFRYGPRSLGWEPVVGDWDGDGSITVGLYDQATSVFYLRNSNTAGVADLTVSFGHRGSGWRPLAGDWNGPAL